MNINENTREILRQLEENSQLENENPYVANLMDNSLETMLDEIRSARANAQFWNTLIEINQLFGGTERRDLLKFIANSVRNLLGADLVILYEGIHEGQFVSPRPGIAGDLFYPQHMEDKVKESTVVHKILNLKTPIYNKKSQSDEALNAELSQREPGRLEPFTVREKIRSTAMIPLIINDESVGLLFVNYRTSQPFDEKQIRSIEAVADHTKIAVHNLRLLRRQIRYSKDLNDLLHIMSEVSSNIHNLEIMLQTVIEQLVDLLQVPRGEIVLWSGDEGIIVAEHKIDDELPSLLGEKFFRKSKLEEKLSEGETILIEDISKDSLLSDFEKEKFQKAHIYSTLIVPAKVNKNYFAAIGIDETRGKRTFTQREIDICKTLAAQVAIALELNQITSYSRLRSIQEEVLNHVYDKDIVFDLILKRGLEIIDAPVGQLYIREANQLHVLASSVPSDIGYRLGIDDSITGLVVQNGNPLIIDDVDNDEIFSKYYKQGKDGRMTSELAVPLVINDEVIGVLNAESPNKGAFSQTDLDLWMILASQAALAIDLAQRLDEERAIAQIRQEIADSSLDFEELIELILARTCDLIGATIGQLILIENEKLVIVASTQEEDQGVTIPKESVTGYVIQGDKTVNINGLETGSEFKGLHKWHTTGEMRSELATPLKRGGKIIGALNLESPKANAFSKANERALEKFASEISVAIELARQENINSWLRKIQDVILGNPAKFDLEAVYNEIIQSGIQLLNSQTGEIFRVKKDDKLEVVASESADTFINITRPLGTLFDIDNCITGIAVKEKRIVNVPDVRKEPYKHLYKSIAKEMVSNIIAPLEIRGQVIGALSFESITPGAFSTIDEPFLLELGRQAAMAIEQAELIELSRIRESSRAEERLAVEVTHRLNNPLGAVRAWTLRADKYLADQELDKLNLAMSQIRNNAQEAMDLVDEMRWRRRDFMAKEIAIDPYIEDFIANYKRNHFVPDGIKIISNLNARFAIIRADDLLYRLFENLFENSIRAMGSKGLLEIGSKIQKEWVEIWVKDNGEGIPKKLIPDVFSEFFTTKPSGAEPGNGLGLWWSKRFVEAYRGTIMLASKPGEWTKVTIRWPVAKPYESNRLADALLS